MLIKTRASVDSALSPRHTRRVAIFLPSLDGGGAERIALNLAAGFAARGQTVDMVLAKAAGAYLNQVPSEVRLVDLKTSRPARAVPALARYLFREKPHALLSTITSANLAALFALNLSRASTRWVVREASTLSVEIQHSSKLDRFLVPRLMSLSAYRAHAVVVPSRAAAVDLACTTGLPTNKIQVIYNPVISDAMSERAKSPSTHLWLHTSALPVIVGMGRLTQQKDFATLVHAFARVRAQMPSRLMILGEGEDRIALEDLAQRLGIGADVSLPGFVDNPYTVLSKAALFVLSSRWEGLPGALIEALACGTPVVSTDCPSGPREILDDGVYGQLVPVGDSERLAEAILRTLKQEVVCKDPRKWLVQFDADANVERYLELLLG